ncbi:MAG: ankyrin repeat domain-containing protein [Betaproteobacteria bacterium]|nr:MAG: ankyrin repeat domain-containing protein [Betaproteobacteria bacterium]
MAAKKEELDFLTRLRIRELVLMGLITITAVLANLPKEYVEDTLGMSSTTLLAVLAIAVIIGLFLYLKFFFFVAVVLLIAGANMPDQIAEGLNISKIPIVLALVALVGIGLINYVVKLVPTGLEPKPKEKSPEGIRAMFYAIEKNNLVYAQKVLSMNFDPNLHHDNGYTPLAYAAMKGSVPMVELLLRNGASAAMTTREGDTPVELALRFGHADAADLLKRARQSAAPDSEPAVLTAAN